MRYNTKNLEHFRSEKTDWAKFIRRHWQFATEAELLNAFGHDTDAVKAIEKKFCPWIEGESVFYDAGESVFCIGYIDKYGPKSYVIALNSQFGEHEEMFYGTEKQVLNRLKQIYKENT